MSQAAWGYLLVVMIAAFAACTFWNVTRSRAGRDRARARVARVIAKKRARSG